MKYALARSADTALAFLLRTRPLLVFDYDGTLAPIVDAREDAVMRPLTRDLLAEIAKRFDCAIISGRSEHDVRERLTGVRLCHVIGNHGVQYGVVSTSEARERSAATRALIDPIVKLFRGAEIEDKGMTLAVHYRHADDPEGLLTSLDEALTPIQDQLRLVGGKCVLNLIPRGAGDKGAALEWLIHDMGAQRTLYVGDDVTDEDAFVLTREPWLLSIRIGHSHSSKASHYLYDQQEIDPLLRRLLDLAYESNEERARRLRYG